MKVIIAGSRGINSYDVVDNAIRQSGFNITEIVHGNCVNSPDMIGDLWARVHDVPIKKFPANWNEYGKSAGLIRNKEMAQYADALIAVWNGKSKGTKHMIDYAKQNGLEVYIDMLVLKDKNSLF